MSAGDSIFCINELTVAGALAGATGTVDAPESHFQAIGPTKAEDVSKSAGVDMAVLGGK